MLRLTLKNLAANRLRFALTAFAVVLAVSFVVSSFVLTDGLRQSFGNLSSEIAGGTDFEIRGETDEFDRTARLDESILEEASAIDGVASAAPIVVAEDMLRPLTAAGQTIPTSGPPQIAFGWIDDDRISSFTVVEGSAPDNPGEFSIDRDAAARHGFVVGHTYDVITPNGTVPHTVTGLVSFGPDNATLGATLMQFELGSLQGLLGTDGYDSVAVALSGGADRGAVEAELMAIAGDGEVVDNATLESETRADFNSGIDIIGNVLLGFAGISLFVSIFIIYNTFSIVLGQRTRELALLRTVGADSRQLRRSVLGEAAAIGVGASALGIGGGVAAAAGLRWLFGFIGAELPEAPVIVSTRTVIVAFAVGIVVTLVSAMGPARRASRVSPMAALRDGAAAGEASGRIRLIIGAVTTGLGMTAGGFGLFGAEGTSAVVTFLAIGAALVFIGVTMLSPVVAKPVTGLLGSPIARAFGVSGRLAQQNAGRHPRRTATTAAALMIGLAMVSMALTVGESLKAQLRSTLESSVAADYLVTDNSDFLPLIPDSLAGDLDGRPETQSVTSFRYWEANIGGAVEFVGATDFRATAELFDLDISDGVFSPDGVTDPLLISNELATEQAIEIGDKVAMTFPSGDQRTVEVVGVFGDDIVIEEDYLLDFSTWTTLTDAPGDAWIALSFAEGVPEDQVEATLVPFREANPGITFETANSFVEDVEGEVDQLLAVVNAMVALAVIIALIGIANTLALSVFERTRELGLLRAVGMTRSQLRRMVRYEAALVAFFGAALGVTIGVLFGWAAVVALPAEFTSTLAVPSARIAILVSFAGLAGLAAAWGPARRAGRLKVLDAISA